MSGADRIQDLLTWQLACELRDQIFTLTETGPASHDGDFRTQIRSASSSAARNLAGVLICSSRGPVANHTRIVCGSLGETQHCVLEGRKRNYFTEGDAARLLSLVRRTRGAGIRLFTSLEPCEEDDGSEL